MTNKPAQTRNWPDVAGQIVDAVHILPVRVYYEDTDFSGYVYHANYIRFCERGRSDCLRLLGFHHNELYEAAPQEQAAWVVRHMDCDFITPARIDELLEVKSHFAKAKGARVIMQQQIMRGDELIFKATVTAALVDLNGRPKRLSAKMLEKFATLAA